MSLPLSPPNINWDRDLPGFTSPLEKILRDGTWASYTGEYLETLCSQLLNATGLEPLLCSSGSIAVELALRAIPIQNGDEVILAGYDYPGNFRCIEAVGGRAVVVDTQPQSWSIDLNLLEDACSPQTKALIVSHLHGELQDMLALKEFAQRRGLILIEDACQAIGGRLEGQPLGTLGDLGIWSFGGSKLVTAGRGGVLFCRNPLMLQRAKVASQRGNDAYALSHLQAAMLVPQLAALPEWTNIRHQSASFFFNQLSRQVGFKFSPSYESAKANPVEKESNAPTVAGYYKLGFFLETHGERDAARRDALINKARVLGAEIGDGFRSFALRSQQRCRKVGDLSQASRAAQLTLLLHHRHLLGSREHLQNLADSLGRLVQSLE